MPNRIIKESLCDSEKIASLSDFAFRLWIGLILQADDAGRGDARPAYISGHIFTFSEKKLIREIQTALAELAEKDCIFLYERDGRPYYLFPNWSKHQRIRESRPKYPAPEGEEPPKQSRKPATEDSGCETDENADLRAIAAAQEAVFEAMKDAGIAQSAKSLQWAERLIAEYSAEWVLEAINRMVGAPAAAQGLRYVEGILKRWKQNGGIEQSDQLHEREKQGKRAGAEKAGTYEPPLPDFIL